MNLSIYFLIRRVSNDISFYLSHKEGLILEGDKYSLFYWGLNFLRSGDESLLCRELNPDLLPQRA